MVTTTFISAAAGGASVASVTIAAAQRASPTAGTPIDEAKDLATPNSS
jgi:hypothetical protein